MSEHEHKSFELAFAGVDEATSERHYLESVGVETGELIALDIRPEHDEHSHVVDREPGKICLHTIMIVGYNVSSWSIEHRI